MAETEAIALARTDAPVTPVGDIAE